ncbi:MAG: ABC transporter ATP-binding protein/permease [Lachnospiraceae bacterium]|nr:ABC transporter ATP-binding protein/permease [Lachnospiraceae bacterium]
MLTVAIGNINPYIYGLLIDAIINKDVKLFNSYLIIYVTVSLVTATLGFFQIISTKLLVNKINNRIKLNVYTKSLSLKQSEFNKYTLGELINRIENDTVTVIQFFIDIITNVFVIGINLALSIYFIFKISYVNAFIALCIPVLSLLLIKLFQSSIKIITKRQLAFSDKYINFLTYTFKDFENIKAYQIENKYGNAFSQFLMENRALLKKHIKVNDFLQLLKSFINNIVNPFLIYVFAIRIMNGILSIGNMVSFNTYVGRFFEATSKILSLNLTSNTIKVSLERLESLNNAQVEDTASGLAIGTIKTIQTQNLQFGYNDDNVFSNLSLHIDSPGLYAIIGENGCGKSTFLKLLLRMYDCADNYIYINGLDINKISLSSLRNEISYASKQSYLINDTILKNIMIGNEDAFFSDVVKLCKKVGLHDYIMSLPEEYDSILDDMGVILSSGQKQRLCLVRTLLRNASLYLLDEITSDLDILAEKDIVDVIKEKAEHSIIFMVSHREMPIRQSKKTFLLTSSGITFQGAFEELKK